MRTTISPLRIRSYFRRSTTTAAEDDSQSVVPFSVYFSVLSVVLLVSLCSCWVFYRVCSPKCCKQYSLHRSMRRRRSASQPPPRVTSVFTVTSSTSALRRVSPPSVRESNIAVSFDETPPSYIDVISNTNKIIVDDEGLPRYETFITVAQPNAFNFDEGVTSLDNRKPVKQLAT